MLTHVARIISSKKIYGLKHHIVEMRGGVTDAGRTNNRRTVKIELLSQWKLEAEFRNFCMVQLSIIWYFWDFVLHGIIWYCLAMSWKHLQHFSVAHESQVGGSGTAKVFGCGTKLAAGAGRAGRARKGWTTSAGCSWSRGHCSVLVHYPRAGAIHRMKSAAVKFGSFLPRTHWWGLLASAASSGLAKQIWTATEIFQSATKIWLFFGRPS